MRLHCRRYRRERSTKGMTDENRCSPVLACDMRERYLQRLYARAEIAACALLFAPLAQVHRKPGFGKSPYDTHLRQQIEYVGPLNWGRHDQNRTGGPGVLVIAAQLKVRPLEHGVPSRFLRCQPSVVQHPAERPSEHIAGEQ